MKSLTDAQIRKARVYKRELKELTIAVDLFLDRLDIEMRKPSTMERGKIIALISNELNKSCDGAKHFGLDVPLNKC